MDESCNLAMPNKKETKKGYIPIDIDGIKNKKEHFRLLDNGQLIRPFTATSVVKMSDQEILSYLDDFKTSSWDDELTNKKYLLAYEEASKRGLVLEMPF